MVGVPGLIASSICFGEVAVPIKSWISLLELNLCRLRCGKENMLERKSDA